MNENSISSNAMFRFAPTHHSVYIHFIIHALFVLIVARLHIKEMPRIFLKNTAFTTHAIIWIYKKLLFHHNR